MLEDTSTNVVISVIRNVISKKSCGLDGISTVIMKYIAEAVASPLSRVLLLNLFITALLSALQLSRVIHVLKSSNKEDSINYRPISLLLVLSKVFEKLVYTRMISFIDKNKIISSFQFGFRHNHSTNHAIIHLTDLISNYLDNSHKIAGIFLDLSKAFDSLDHDVLLQKLYAYGFRG